jgi:glucan phosphoethanolaminetransferase (alkaline phosphatase superfamily)
LGTLVSWIGLITVTFAIYLTSNKIHRTNNSIRQIIRIVSGSTIILALLWGLIGFLFAGNWAFVFQNHDEFRGSIEASRYFWIFTASLVLLPVLLLLTVLFMLLLKKLLRRSER